MDVCGGVEQLSNEVGDALNQFLFVAVRVQVRQLLAQPVLQALDGHQVRTVRRQVQQANP